MIYEIETTQFFDNWFKKIKDVRFRARIALRFDHIRMGVLGDRKSLGRGLFELRFFFGPGFRVYYTIKNRRIVFLLAGGDKSSQDKDIEKARTIISAIEE
jgi:putative addiction module killer protein